MAEIRGAKVSDLEILKIRIPRSLTLAPPISAVRAPIFKPRKLRTSPLPEFYHAYHFWGFLVLLELPSIRSMSLEKISSSALTQPILVGSVAA